jgi:hypothetical protein
MIVLTGALYAFNWATLYATCIISIRYLETLRCGAFQVSHDARDRASSAVTGFCKIYSICDHPSHVMELSSLQHQAVPSCSRLISRL